MLEAPCLGVIAHRVPHRAVADDATKRREHERRFTVRLKTVKWAGVVSIPHEWRLQLVAADASVGDAQAVQFVRLLLAIGVGEDVHVLIESLVHPSVPGLVDADNHRPTLVSGFVVRRENRGHDEHRVFHSQLRSIDHRQLREGVGHPELRVELERVADHALEFYSKLWMPYAFPQLTMVDGPELGMEYPMFIMSGVFAADHETGHEWWPMMVGVNETWYGWMDEGFNQYMNILSDADLLAIGVGDYVHFLI